MGNFQTKSIRSWGAPLCALTAFTSLSACDLSSTGSSFELKLAAQPTSAQAGEIFSSPIEFGYYRLSNNTIFPVFNDTLTASAYSDAACSTAADGTFSLSANGLSMQTGMASFSGASFVYSPASLEGKLYIRARSERLGILKCSNSISILKKFNIGSGYAVSGTTTTAGGTGANLDSAPQAIAWDHKYRLVIGGRSRNSSGGNEATIWRYNGDGSLDQQWTGGSTGLAGGTGASTYDMIMGLATDASGNIYAAGRTTGAGMNTALGVWKYKPDGTLDTTFASSGTYWSSGLAGAAGANRRDYALGAFMDTDGNFVAYGLSGPAAPNYAVFAAWKFNATTGALIGSYNPLTDLPTGYFNVGASQIDNLWGAKQDSQGRYIFGGSSNVNGSNGHRVVILRLNKNLTLDTSFGSGGYAVGAALGVGGQDRDYGWSMTLDSSDRVYVAGDTRPTASAGWTPRQGYVMRFSSNGALDTGFGTSGAWTMTTSVLGLTGASIDDSIRKVYVDSSGRVFLVGTVTGAAGVQRWVVFRLTSAGVLDTGFGSGLGYVLGPSTTTIAGGSGANLIENALWAEVDPFGRLVFVGTSRDSSGRNRVAVWRMNLESGALDL